MRSATVVGAGPNGLAAAIALVQRGVRVHLIEANETVGGGCRSGEATLPGFVHDHCSAIHPLAFASPFLKTLPLDRFGLEWIVPPVAVAHPFDDGNAAMLTRSIDESAARLGPDAAAWRSLMEPSDGDFDALLDWLLGPFQIPRSRGALRFGLNALQPASRLARRTFKRTETQALFSGLAAHSMLDLDAPISAGFGLTLGVAAHATGWPFPRGGAQSLSDALAACFIELGGSIETGRTISRIEEIETDGPVLFDLTPKQLLAIAGDRISGPYRKQIEHYRHGPGALKIDWALDGPVPWRSPECHLAGTIHLGGSIGEIEHSERLVQRGSESDTPFVIAAQPSRFDRTRAPDSQEVLWAYCHVPHGSKIDMTERIEAQIERFAPGFRERILTRHVTTPADFEAANANYIGGDINGGVQDMRQLFTRPAIRRDPYATSDPGIFLCSSSTPPGGGVHGMCGYHAANSVFRRHT